MGNNILHQIAKSAHASNFIERLANQDRMSQDTPFLDITNNRIRPFLTNSINSDGMTWLEILVNKGDTRSLDQALSPNHKLAWDLTPPYNFERDKMESLKDCVQRKGNQIMQLIIETHEETYNMKEIYDGIVYDFQDTEERLLASDRMLLLRQDDAKLNAAKFVRFLSNWSPVEKDHLRVDVLSIVVMKGYSRLFELFYIADSTWFWCHKNLISPNDDDGRYIQPELSSMTSDLISADMIQQCIIGCVNDKFEESNATSQEFYFVDVK